MNMPGFTAESSAYKTRGHYRHYQMASGFTNDSASVFQPQACDLACVGNVGRAVWASQAGSMRTASGFAGRNVAAGRSPRRVVRANAMRQPAGRSDAAVPTERDVVDEHQVGVLLAHAASARHPRADPGRAGVEQRDQPRLGDHLIQRVQERSLGQNACMLGWNLNPRTPRAISSRASRTPSLPLCGSTLRTGSARPGSPRGPSTSSLPSRRAHAGLVVDREQHRGHPALAVVGSTRVSARIIRMQARSAAGTSKLVTALAAVPLPPQGRLLEAAIGLAGNARASHQEVEL